MSQPLEYHSSRKAFFSWEKKPGISKVTTTTTHGETLPRHHEILAKLPPPPCTQQQQQEEEVAPTTIARNHVHDYQIPLPPCAFQPPCYRTSSKKGLFVQDHDDPFLAAYKECTKNTKFGEKRNKKLGKGGIGIESKLKKGVSFFSCKRSCSVHDKDLVRITSLPHNMDRD